MSMTVHSTVHIMKKTLEDHPVNIISAICSFLQVCHSRNGECLFLSARSPSGRAETESRNFVCWCVGLSVCCYLLILLQSFQCRGGIISDLCSLCRSQSLGTSHSMILSPSTRPPPPPPPPPPPSPPP